MMLKFHTILTSLHVHTHQILCLHANMTFCVHASTHCSELCQTQQGHLHTSLAIPVGSSAGPASPDPCVSVVGCRWGLRLATTRCRHWGYMGVETCIGRAPCPCVVVVIVVWGAWGCGPHYPRRHVVIIVSRSWSTSVASRIGRGATLPPHCRRHRRCTAIEACVAPAQYRAIFIVVSGVRKLWTVLAECHSPLCHHHHGWAPSVHQSCGSHW